MTEISGYQLTRSWFDFCFANPEKITPSHTAIFVFAIEHCNRLGWKEKFGFPSQMTMDALGIKKHQTYIRYFNDLVDWGFFKLIQKSTNQYSANIISLSIGKTKNGKALDKAWVRHAAKHGSGNGQSTWQSKDSIDKPINQVTSKPINQYTRGVDNSEFFSNAFDERTIETLRMAWPNVDISDELKKFKAHVSINESYDGRDISGIRQAFTYALRKHSKPVANDLPKFI